MWLTCSRKPMPRPSSWLMNSDRYFPLDHLPFLLNVSLFFFSGVWCDALLFVLQELINRHLITMAQIDHSENPGKGSTVLSKGCYWLQQFLLQKNPTLYIFHIKCALYWAEDHFDAVSGLKVNRHALLTYCTHMWSWFPHVSVEGCWNMFLVRGLCFQFFLFSRHTTMD